MNAIISLLFPVLAKYSGGLPFAFFAAMTTLQFFVVLFVYPETKGISLEQLQRKLGIALLCPKMKLQVPRLRSG
jgi:SP family arabinose:H+ symporter-like MFS transporter